jgi:SNF2 family DNA or RNA helicase
MISYFAGFTKIASNPITLHKPISDENIRLIYGDKKLVIVDAEDIPESSRSSLYLNIYNIPKTEYNDKKLYFNYYYGKYYIYPYLNELCLETMANEPIKFISRTNYFINNRINTNHRKGFLFVKIEKSENMYFISYYIKDEIIENCKVEFSNSSTISRYSHLLIQLLMSQKQNDLVKQNDDILSNIKNFDYKEQFESSTEDLVRHTLLKPDIRLYNYQKQDILWMKQIEQDVDNGSNIIQYDYCEEYKVPISKTSLEGKESLTTTSLEGEEPDDYYLYEFDNGKCSLSPHKTIYENTQKSFEYYGGNIISEVGLGKTIITLYYILQNDRELQLENEKFVKFGDTCNYFYKRGKDRGNCCTRSKYMNFHYCKQHIKTPFIDKRRLVLQNLDQFDFNRYIMYLDEKDDDEEEDHGLQPFIKTNASLIICKAQLCDQWVQEYYDKFENNHRILLVVTYDQYTNITLSDLLFSDIVIISYEFLSNKRYLENIEGSTTNLLSMYLASYNSKDNSRLLDTKKFNCFSMFYWNRIMYDEAHEIPKTLFDKISLYSKYKWNITGTPFVDKSYSFIKLMSYNTNYIEKFDLCHSFPFSTKTLIKKGFSNGDIINKCKFLFRRNTKDSILLEYDKNIINEYTNLLEFTPQERSIYDGYVSGARGNYVNFLIRLCCHPELNEDTREMIKNCKTFNEIHNCLLNYNKHQIETEEKRIKNIESDIKSYEDILSEENIDEEEEEVIRLQIKINLLKRKLTIKKKNYESISRTYNYLKTTLENLQTSEMCPICLDEIDIENLTITKCGHKFCWDCLYQTHKAKGSSIIKCPSCNTLMSNKDIYLLKNSEQVSTSHDELYNIIQTVKSTKIGNIIYFLNKILGDNNKVILFSQWDELLHKVGSILSNQNIKLVYSNGSVYQRKRAINRFYKDPDVNLILLSSKNSASGINLTIANKIIFLEPIYGNREYRKNVECQAIGRADRLGQKRPIDIYRFIIKDTIEQDIYNNCIDDLSIL